MNEKLSRAKETFHSTTLQAATIAQKAHVHKLMIGHYSARYKDLQPLLEEVQTIFKNTILAIEGENIHVESVPYPSVPIGKVKNKSISQTEG